MAMQRFLKRRYLFPAAILTLSFAQWLAVAGALYAGRFLFAAVLIATAWFVYVELTKRPRFMLLFMVANAGIVGMLSGTGLGVLIGATILSFVNFKLDMEQGY